MLPSCRNEFREHKTKQIDSLQKVISEVQKKLIKADTSEYRTVYNKIKSITKVFKEDCLDIPKDQDFRNRFAAFTQLEKNYKTFFKDYYMSLNDLSFTSKQLDNLKSDIQNNTIKEQDKITIYFNQESESVRKIMNKTENIIPNAEAYKATYHTLCEEMESFAEKLKKTTAKK